MQLQDKVCGRGSVAVQGPPVALLPVLQQTIVLQVGQHLTLCAPPAPVPRHGVQGGWAAGAIQAAAQAHFFMLGSIFQPLHFADTDLTS